MIVQMLCLPCPGVEDGRLFVAETRPTLKQAEKALRLDKAKELLKAAAEAR